MTITLNRHASPLRGMFRGHRIARTGTRKLITLRALGWKLAIVYGPNRSNGMSRLGKGAT
jgi:hypothetical protein